MRRKFALEQAAIRLVREAPLLSDEEIRTPEDAVRILADAFQDYDREVVGVVNLKSDNTPINMTIVSMGTLNQSIVHPREMLKAAFLSNAASILMFHNHPSGDVTPSREDIAMTGRMQQVCMLAGVPVIDHVILGGNREFYSFRDKNVLPLESAVFSAELEDIDLKQAEKVAEQYGYKRETGGRKSIKESLEEKKKIASAQKSPSGRRRAKETMRE